MHVMAQTHPMSHIEDMHDMDRTWNPEIGHAKSWIRHVVYIIAQM
jgi:hypothetical protein